MLMKEIKDLNIWRDILCSLIGRHNIVKMWSLPKMIYRFKATSVKFSARFFVDEVKLILKFIWEDIGPSLTKTIWKRIQQEPKKQNRMKWWMQNRSLTYERGDFKVSGQRNYSISIVGTTDCTKKKIKSSPPTISQYIWK